LFLALYQVSVGTLPFIFHAAFALSRLYPYSLFLFQFLPYSISSYIYISICPSGPLFTHSLAPIFSVRLFNFFFSPSLKPFCLLLIFCLSHFCLCVCLAFRFPSAPQSPFLLFMLL
jgi:hypothetical protein